MSKYDKLEFTIFLFVCLIQKSKIFISVLWYFIVFILHIPYFHLWVSGQNNILVPKNIKINKKGMVPRYFCQDKMSVAPIVGNRTRPIRTKPLSDKTSLDIYFFPIKTYYTGLFVCLSKGKNCKMRDFQSIQSMSASKSISVGKVCTLGG